MRADQMKGSSMKQCCSVKRFLAFSVVLSILGSLAVASKSFADQIVYMGGSAYESTVGGVGAPSVVKLRAKATEHAAWAGDSLCRRAGGTTVQGANGILYEVLMEQCRGPYDGSAWCQVSVNVACMLP